jgi:cytidyltransferase-like protein
MKGLRKKVFVSGCFDLFHGGHAEFLRRAGRFGDLYVAVGSDNTVLNLKDVKTTFNEKERAFIVGMVKGVKKVFVSSGFGELDFVEELKKIRPDIFVVNEDGHSEEKQKLCKSLGICYKVLKRFPKRGLPERSSTEMRAKRSNIPYRIDLAGGWLDQPYVSKKYPGGVITISVEPNNFFGFRSGVASSTRNRAIKLWGEELPKEDPIYLAKLLFSFENLPGTRVRDVAGAQDAIGIAVPGLAYSFFNGKYWPEKIDVLDREDVLSWVESRIFLVKLYPRKEGYNVFAGKRINKKNAKKLSFAARDCYEAIQKKDFEGFAKSFVESFEAQTSLFPATFPDEIRPIIREYKRRGAKAWKLSGAGGGGYLVLVSEKPIEGAIPIKIRRR